MAAEITRTETSERARLLRLDSCDISLDLAGGERTFGSVSVITFDCGEAGASSYADLVAETVHEVSLNGTMLDPAEVCADGRIMLPGLAAGRNQLRVVADCAYGLDGTGLHRAVDSADGRVYCYTHCEPADARKIYANFEQPDLKASFSFHVTAPAHWVVLSNQPTPAPEAAGAEVATWHFAPTARISTYLTALVAGEYHLVRATHTTPSGQVIPLGLACRQSLASYLDPDDMFTLTRQGFDHFTRLFQLPYPFTKYDQVLVPEFPAGAMENPGLVTFSEQHIYRSKVTDAQYETRAGTILHEMAHMWFGDLVTMRWWDDLWLNESFAEFSAAQASVEATRFTDAWTTFCGGRKMFGYLADQQPSTHPIAADVETLSEAIANFDGISYPKGGAVLKQLAAFTGRDNFYAGIRAYLAEHGWANATLADLLAAVAASSGRDLTEWAALWLQTAGPNTLRPDFETGADGSLTRFTIVQSAPADHPTLRPHRVAVGLYNRDDSGALVRIFRAELDIAGERTDVPALAGQRRPDLILLNDDDLTFAIVRFDERSLATLTTSIGDFADSLPRTVCWSAIVDMALQAELSLPRFARIVAAGLASEQSISVLQTLAAVLSQLLSMTGDPAWLPQVRGELAEAAARLLRTAEPGSDRQLAWAQLLAAHAITPAQLDLVAGLLAGNEPIDGLAVDTELRWALLRRLASTGRAADADIDAELGRDDTDAGRRHAQASRAAMPDAAHKAQAWELLTQAADLGTDTALAVAGSFAQADHAELLAPYAQRYFELLPELWASRGEQFRFVISQLLFPYAGASPELLARVDDFLAAGDRNPGLARVLIQGRDMVDKALRARTLPD